jgi:hypothetical protein
MRGTILLCLLCSAAVCAPSYVSHFDPNGYQHPDGAISLHYRGEYIEPYFATKALIVAQESGLDADESVQQWIRWLLPRQNKDGSFERYCRKPGNQWRSCAPSDADDSMLALWLQLLYTNAPDSGMPAEWENSVHKARASLQQLRNGRLGVYHVSRQNHVALLMDNVEVYSALKEIARSQQRLGYRFEAQITEKEAEKLDVAIQQVFWNKHADWFRPSIQKSRPEFYPDVVAQVFPWLADMPVDSDLHTDAAWARWKTRFAADWLDKRFDPHPWGLVAMTALKFGDTDSAACWLSRSEPLRFSTNWNVLEESAFQAVQARIGAVSQTSPSACSRVVTAP